MRDSNGDPVSALIAELSGKPINLPFSSSGPNLFQALGSRWRDIASTSRQIIDALESFPYAISPDGRTAIEAFKRLIYDSTELFDVYTQLFPSIVSELVSKSDLKSYSSAAKRLRTPWALICNKCKHSGSQIIFVWAKSRINGATSGRYMVCSFKDGNALVRDEEVHKGGRSGVCLTRSVKELLHALLRVDLLAAKLVRAIKKHHVQNLQKLSGFIKIGKELSRIEPLYTMSFSDESIMFDSFSIEPSRVVLNRSSTGRLIDPVHITTLLQGDGVTTTFSFA